MVNHDLFGKKAYVTKYVDQANIKMKLAEAVLPAGTELSWNDPENNLIMVILDGTLMVNGAGVGTKNTTVVLPAGRQTDLVVDMKSGVHAMVMVKRAPKLLAKPLIVSEDDRVWLPDYENGHFHLYLKNLLTPDQIGGCVMRLTYPAGHITEWHDHTFTHAAYVLNGVFVNETEDDEGEQYFGPGSFICGPKGQIMRHGAADEQSCDCYFFTDAPFSLHYVDKVEKKK